MKILNLSPFFLNMADKVRHFVLLLKLKARKKTQIQMTARQRTIAAVLFLGLIAFLWDRNHENSTAPPPQQLKSVDTYIPTGFVLVPIQLINAEALDSMMGSSGVVDLFIPDHKKPGRSKKIAERIKIIRAPLNPNQFAVLVPEASSSNLVHYEGAYFAVVQNPKTTGTQLEQPQRRKVSSRIIMEDRREIH